MLSGNKCLIDECRFVADVAIVFEKKRKEKRDGI